MENTHWIIHPLTYPCEPFPSEEEYLDTIKKHHHFVSAYICSEFSHIKIDTDDIHSVESFEKEYTSNGNIGDADELYILISVIKYCLILMSAISSGKYDFKSMSSAYELAMQLHAMIHMGAKYQKMLHTYRRVVEGGMRGHAKAYGDCRGRHRVLFEQYEQLRKEGHGKMDAYNILSRRHGISQRTVRRACDASK